MEYQKKSLQKHKIKEKNSIFMFMFGKYNQNDVIVVCSKCGKTKLVWEIVCTNCKDTQGK